MSGRDGYAAASTDAVKARAWFVCRYAADRIDEPLVQRWMRSPLDDRGMVIAVPPVLLEWLAAVGPPPAPLSEKAEIEDFATAMFSGIDEIRRQLDAIRPMLLGATTGEEVIERARFLAEASGAGRDELRAWADRRSGATQARAAFVALDEAAKVFAMAWAAVAPAMATPRGRGQDRTDEQVRADTRLVRAFVEHVTKAGKVTPAPAALAAIALEYDPPCIKAADFKGRREKWEDRLKGGG